MPKHKKKAAVETIASLARVRAQENVKRMAVGTGSDVKRAGGLEDRVCTMENLAAIATREASSKRMDSG